MLIEALAGMLNNRASLETPSTPLTGSKIYEILGGGMSAASGVQITNETVLSHPAIFRGCQLIANGVSKLPLHVYKKDGDNRDEETGHPASRLLRWRANDFVRSSAFIKSLVGNALLHGNGYAQIFRRNSGAPFAMDWLDPGQTYPVVADGVLFYQTRIEGRDKVLRASDIFHIRGLGWSGLIGWSVIDKLKDALGVGIASQAFTSAYFKNNAQPRVIIKFPGYLDDQTAVERFRSSWGSVHAGVENAHKPAILEGGAEVEPFQMSNTDAQLVPLRELDIRVVSTILGIPSHMLGDNSKTSFASLEQENQRHLDDAIDPWLREIEDEANDKLMTERESQTGSVFAEFVRSAGVRTNIKDRYAAYNIGIQAGFMSRAQVRRLETWNVDDDELETYLQPLNMVEAGTEPAEPDNSAGGVPALANVASEAVPWRAKLRSATEHTTELLVTRIARAAEKAARNPSTFLNWIDVDMRKHKSKFVADFAAASNVEVAEELAGECFDTMAAGLLECSGNVTASQLPETVSQVVGSYLVDLPPQVAADLITKMETQSCDKD